MKLVIVGAGKVGETLVSEFVNENHDIVVVDVDQNTVSGVVNRYDVNGVIGGGLERTVLLDAGVDKADFLIACTSRDEVNILCSVLGKKLGAKHTIARVRDPEYFKEVDNMKDVLGLDYAFNPELATANEIVQVLKFPSANTVDSFAKGRAVMVDFDILEGNPLIGQSLKEISSSYGKKILIAMVLRGEEVIIPHGDFVVEENDNLHIIASETEITAFCKKLKIFKPRAKNVFVIGGGKIAYYLAQKLIANGVNVKIVEKDEERAKELSASLPKARVILADATEQEVLDEENLKGCDACVTLTGMDEQNLIVSLYAKQSGVEKVVSKVDRQSVLNMVKMLGLDTVVTPKSVIANQIIRFVRASQTASGDGINNLYKLHDKVEALEFTVSEKFPALNKKLKEIGIKKNVLVGGIVRGDEFILPSGETEFVAGDKVIVVTAISKIAELVQILN